MVRQSNDGTGTQFSLWLRKQHARLPSSYAPECFTFHNLDFVVNCYRGPHENEWMIVEEKRYNSKLRFAQLKVFKILEGVCYLDPKFRGFHLLQFEKTNPEDGKIWLDKNEITPDNLIKFLRFEGPRKLYLPTFPETVRTRESIVLKNKVLLPPGSHQKYTVLPLEQLKLNEYGGST